MQRLAGGRQRRGADPAYGFRVQRRGSLVGGWWLSQPARPFAYSPPKTCATSPAPSNRASPSGGSTESVSSSTRMLCASRWTPLTTPPSVLAPSSIPTQLLRQPKECFDGLQFQLVTRVIDPEMYPSTREPVVWGRTCITTRSARCEQTSPDFDLGYDSCVGVELHLNHPKLRGLSDCRTPVFVAVSPRGSSIDVIGVAWSCPWSPKRDYALGESCPLAEPPHTPRSARRSTRQHTGVGTDLGGWGPLIQKNLVGFD